MRYGFALLISLAALCGCGGGSAPLPSAESARRALEAGLEAWKGGRPASALSSGRPAVDFVDSQWKAGKALVGYSITSEATGEGTLTFAASLSLAGEAAAVEARYMAFGVDPVRIFREEDYERAMNMEDSPAPPKAPKKRR